jgi:hypothetical protein
MLRTPLREALEIFRQQQMRDMESRARAKSKWTFSSSRNYFEFVHRRACPTRTGLQMQGDTNKAKVAYQDFVNLWKDADPDRSCAPKICATQGVHPSIRVQQGFKILL